MYSTVISNAKNIFTFRTAKSAANAEQRYRLSNATETAPQIRRLRVGGGGRREGAKPTVGVAGGGRGHAQVRLCDGHTGDGDRGRRRRRRRSAAAGRTQFGARHAARTGSTRHQGMSYSH